MTAVERKTRKFGKYRLIKKIGVGGMAEVYKAEYSGSSGKPIAIKRILADFSRDKKLISMLINEAKVAMLLNHPNVVPIYDFGLVDNHYFIAMEYVNGKDLRTFLKKAYSDNAKFPMDIVFYVMICLLEGLAYAHSRKDNFNKPLEIIHRDISPQNIMVSYDGEVKILDFGIAKAKGSHFEIAKSSGSLTETQAGILKGKFSYMSPEQAKGKTLDQRSDLFSAGIVMWEMLTIQSLFGGQSEVKIIEKVRKADIPDPAAKNPDITKDLSKIVFKALKRKKWSRYQTAEQFKNELLLWGYKEGLLINKDFMREYIHQEFPYVEDDPTNTMEFFEQINRAEGIPDSIGSIDNNTSEFEIEESGTHLKSKGVAPLDSISGSIGSISRIAGTLQPSAFAGFLKKAKRLASLKLLGIIIAIVFLTLIFMYRDKLRADSETFRTFYKYAVIKPRKLVHKKSIEEAKKIKFTFNPNDVFMRTPRVFLSHKASNYLLRQNLATYESLIENILLLADKDRYNSIKKCSASSDNFLCAQFDRFKIFYGIEKPENNIIVESIIP